MESRIAPAFAGALDLSALDGANGLQLAGVDNLDDAGCSVSAAGDVNGDGLGDFIVGARLAGQFGVSPGEAYIIFGKMGGFGASFPLSTVNGTNGFKLSGTSLFSEAGATVASAGDVNGDGFDDLLVSSPGADDAGINLGTTYVVFGKASGFAANFDLGSVDGTNGFKVIGAGGNSAEGSGTVAGLGDMNGDGFDDVILTMGGNRAAIVFGKASGFAPSIAPTSLNGSDGFRFTAPFRGSGAFSSVAAAGDINGDGFDDAIIGAAFADGGATTSGVAYVLFGGMGPFGFNGDATFGGFFPISGFIIEGIAEGDRAGTSVGGAGDVNGDGFDDVIVGASSAAEGGFLRGAAYVVFGHAGATRADSSLSSLNGSNGFKLSGVADGDETGRAVAGAGDINADGYDDLIVGAPFADETGTQSGAAYVFLGKPGGFGASVALASLDGSNGFKIRGASAADYAGDAVNRAGDVNGDGVDDLLVGAPNAEGGGDRRGVACVVFGVGIVQQISIADASGAEGQSGTSSFTFTVSLAKPSTQTISVHVSTTNGTAVAGDDFVAINDLLVTFAPGEASKTVTVDVVGDSTSEPNETFTVVLSNATNAPIGAGSATGFILNDDQPTVSIGDASISESQSGARMLAVPVTLSHPTLLPVSVRVTTSDGTATANADYFPLFNFEVTFAPGQTSANVLLDVLGDSMFETDETFTLTLSNAVNAELGNATATGTILNDDPLLVSIGNVTLAEGNAGTTNFTFLVSLNGIATVPVTVRASTIAGTALAGTDFTALNDVLIEFAPGETDQSVTVTVLGDAVPEPDEVFSVVLSNPTNTTLGTTTATGTILNDDRPVVSIGDASIAEGNAGTRTLSLPVTLSAAYSQTVSVYFATVDGTALSGSDYTAVANQVITFAPGETSKTAQVSILGDTLFEADEILAVVLSNPTNADLGDGTGIATILNDDELLVSVGDVTLAEGNSGVTSFVFTISLSGPALSPVSVHAATVGGTANAGSDFAAIADLLMQFAPGDTSKTVAVDVLGDALFEQNETFTLVLTGATNATIATSAGTGTILNDDAPSVSVGNSAKPEGHSGTNAFSFEVTLAGPTTLPVSVRFATVDGIARAIDNDFAAVDQEVTFLPGEVLRTIDVPVNGDTGIEANELFNVALSSPTNATLGQATGIGIIVNDDNRGIDARTVQLADVDGDVVTVRVSKGLLDFTNLEFEATANGPIISAINLPVTGHSGATLTVTAKTQRGQAGDGRVNVGAINASNLDLAKVVVDGDLGSITIGSGAGTRAGVGVLQVASLGQERYLAGGEPARVDINGSINRFNSTGAVVGLEAAITGKVGSVNFQSIGDENALGDRGKVTFTVDGSVDRFESMGTVVGFEAVIKAGLGSLIFHAKLNDAVFDVANGIKSIKAVDDLANAAFKVGQGIKTLIVTGSVTNSEIQVGTRLAKMIVLGSVTDSEIRARGSLLPGNSTAAIAVGSVAVRGSFTDSELLAGYDRAGLPVNADVRIGKVTINGSFNSSSIVAGIARDGDGFFATDGNTLIAGGNVVTSRIASVVIKGSVNGTAATGDRFGIVAEEVGAVKIGGQSMVLERRGGNDLTGLPLGGVSDVIVREYPPTA